MNTFVRYIEELKRWEEKKESIATRERIRITRRAYDISLNAVWLFDLMDPEMMRSSNHYSLEIIARIQRSMQETKWMDDGLLSREKEFEAQRITTEFILSLQKRVRSIA